MWQGFRKRLPILVVVLASCLAAHAQQRREYLKTATVAEANGVVTVSANDPRPLAQALCAIAKRHEWLVDYEDPPYANAFDLIDVTDPAWRAKNPNARAAFVPAGGAFTFEYEPSSSVTEEMILQRMVAAYNRSGNPGKFEVRDEGTDSRPWSKSRKRYAIVGLSIRDEKGEAKQVAPILDTVISLSTEDRNANQTVGLIANEISGRTGIKVFGGAYANNALIQSKVRVGGENVSARTLLLETLQQMDNPSLIWRLKWDGTSRAYYLNLGITGGCQ